MIRILVISLLTLLGADLHAAELGEVTATDPVRKQIQFYIGQEDIQVGEALTVLTPEGAKVASVKVTEVNPPYARANITALNLGPDFTAPILRPGCKVRISVDQERAASFSFMVGADDSAKVGGYGGVGYSVGLSVVLPLENGLLTSLQLQADDLGKDSAGNGKRTSYYMIGVGYKIHGLMLLGHIGEADYMTMPSGPSSSTVDPYTGATYPSNVHHDGKFGYLLLAKYPLAIRPLDRNHNWGWGISPALTYGSAFLGGGYKPTAAALVCFDLITAL